MKIAFIGAGNLATHLAKELVQSGHQISQIYSRTIESAKALADEVNSAYTIEISEIIDSADLYIFSVKDSALQSLIDNMPHNNGVWIHTAGSISSDIFKNKLSSYGVLYPLQTFSKNRQVNWKAIPVFIEGSNNDTLSTIKLLAKQLSEKIYELQTEKRIYIHTAAVFACNFVNHMYEQAKKLSDQTDMPFDILLPLIEETCNKVHEITPHEAQTGPASRFDINVMDKHINLLKDEDAKAIYKLISSSIHHSFKGL